MEEIYINPTEAKSSSIKTILYLDFKTLPVTANDIPDGYAKKRYFEPLDAAYMPYPSDHCNLEPYGTLSKLVWNTTPNDEFHTHTFTNLKATFNFICQEKHQAFIVIAHGADCFDFQFLKQKKLSPSKLMPCLDILIL